jgi:hypothetical protein
MTVGGLLIDTADIAMLNAIADVMAMAVTSRGQYVDAAGWLPVLQMHQLVLPPERNRPAPGQPPPGGGRVIGRKFSYDLG